MERRFQILEVDLTLSGPPEAIRPIAFAYQRFATSSSAPEGAPRVVLELPGDGTLRVNGRAVPLVPELAPEIQLHHRLHTCLVDAIGSCAILHAAGLVDPRGGALILAAPSAHGKSSLALELAHRGLGLLSDDIAPLDLAQRLVRPFPRAAGVSPSGRSPLPEPFRAPARSPSSVSVVGKSLLDVGEILGDSALAREPAPLHHVFLLVSGDSASSETTLLELTSRSQDAGELDDLFSRTAGVEVVERQSGPHLCAWRLRLHHDRRPTEALAKVLDSERIVSFAKHWDIRPDFASAPEATPVKRREAAALLGRELLNRRSGGALLARYGGSLPRLFVDLAGALRDAACWRLRMGDMQRTADLIEQLVGTPVDSNRNEEHEKKKR